MTLLNYFELVNTRVTHCICLICTYVCAIICLHARLSHKPIRLLLDKYTRSDRDNYLIARNDMRHLLEGTRRMILSKLWDKRSLGVKNK